MFYDYDILNRRGGKFGIIWLAANEKLKFTGKGSKQDIRLLMSVNVERTCQDIIRCVLLKCPPNVPNQPSPRFSLYLAAMLAHGAIVVHNRQIKHEMAHIQLRSVSQAVEKKMRERNLNSKLLDLSNNAQLADNVALSPNISLAEREFGRLIEVAGVFSNGFVDVHYIASPAGLENFEHDRITVENIDNDFTDLQSAFRDAFENPNGHFAAEHDITLRDVDPLPMFEEMKEPTLDENFGSGILEEGGLLGWEPQQPQLPTVAEIDIVTVEQVQGADSSRVNTEGQQEQIGDDDNQSKRPRLDSEAEETQPNKLTDPVNMQIDLAPLPEVQPRRRYRRRRRLVVDRVIAIPIESMRLHVADYTGLLRVRDAQEDYATPSHQAPATINRLFSQPSRAMPNTTLRHLVTRNMRTRQADVETSFPTTEADNIRQNVGDPDLIDQPLQLPGPADQRDNTEGFQPEVEHTFPKPAPILEDPVGQLEARNSPRPETYDPLPLFEESLSGSVEALRLTHSRDASYSGSISGINTSRIDISATERSRTSPNQIPERLPPLETLKEVSVEASTISSRLTGAHSIDTTGISARLTESRLTEEPAQDPTRHTGSRLTDLVSRPRGQTRTRNLPRDLPEILETRHSLGGVNIQLDLEGSIDLPPLLLSTDELEHQLIITPSLAALEGQDLVAHIQSFTAQNVDEPLTFKKLVPLAGNSRLTAARVFSNLLCLQKERKITLEQEQTKVLPYKDIFINLNQ